MKRLWKKSGKRSWRFGYCCEQCRVVSNTVKKIEQLTTADFDATFKTNVYAPFWITKAALPHLKAQSVIINTSSVRAFKPSPILLDYAQTKACPVAFTKSLAKQLGAAWDPGQCGRSRPVLDGAAVKRRTAGGKKVQNFGGDTPLGRPGQPVEIAPLYVTLASDACSYASGRSGVQTAVTAYFNNGMPAAPVRQSPCIVSASGRWLRRKCRPIWFTPASRIAFNS